MSAGILLREALVSGSPFPTSAEDRVRPNMMASEDAAPYIAFIRTNNVRDYGLGGVLLAKTETFNIFCWGVTPEDASALEDQVEPLLIAAGFAILPNEPDGAAEVVQENCAVLTAAYITTPQIT